MIAIEPKIGGNELTKVLHFYGLLESNEDEFKIVCPFHQDILPSLQVTLHDNFWYCHGCARSGNAMQFVRYVNQDKDDLQACIEYHKILHSSKVKHLKLSDRHIHTKLDNKQALIEAEDYYFGLKQTNWDKDQSQVKDYMVKRGFTANTLNKCKARYTYNDSYPIIFPMNDLGKFKGWVCRTTNKKVEKRRKYLYNEGFCRRNTLVGDYAAKVVVLVEGYMDYLKMKQYGVKKVAAILGWKLTEQQITKLKEQGVEVIISALDNDSCGKRGTEYCRQFFNVIRFQYPDNVKDPGDMNQQVFDIANKKTKQLYKEALKNGFSRGHQKSGKKIRSK